MADETKDAAQPQSQPATLAEALLCAQRSVESVTKGSRNEHHGFNYASAEDVLAGARLALDAAGLVVFQRDQEFDPVQLRPGAAFQLHRRLGSGL